MLNRRKQKHLAEVVAAYTGPTRTNTLHAPLSPDLSYEALVADPVLLASFTLSQAIAIAMEAFAGISPRLMPWRELSTTPFQLLIAEFLLRQTRAENAAKVWSEIVARFPTAVSLAAAEPNLLLSLVEPLGLGVQRVKVLETLSNAIANNGEEVPSTLESLMELPHVGLYIAHAIACFAFDQRVPVVDVNVLRVVERLTGETLHIDNRETPRAWEVAGSAVQFAESPRDFNYGLLDFASVICQARDPQCGKCALRRNCQWAMAHGRSN